MNICRTSGADPDFVAVIQRLTALLSELNGEQDGFYQQFNQTDPTATVVVGYHEGRPVASGAFRPMDQRMVEIKRMFVDPELRGKGFAKAILKELEAWAREEGYEQAVLETSKRLVPAVTLYQSQGYRRTENYPPYEGVEDSVCFAKSLTP